MSERPRPPKLKRPCPAPVRRSPTIDALASMIAQTDDPHLREELIENFWQTRGESSPLLETAAGALSGASELGSADQLGDADEQLLTFLWRSSTAKSVLLFVNRLTDETDLERSELARVPNSDVWHLSYALEPDWRGSYGFLTHEGEGPAPWHSVSDQVSLRMLLDRASADPRGALTCPNRAGATLSVAEMSEAPPQPWRNPDSALPAPNLRRSTAPNGRECWLYEPPSDAASHAGDAGPLWVILDGEVWVERFDLPRMLDAMIRDGSLPPVHAVFVCSGGVAHRWDELGQGADFVDSLADSTLPWARQAFGIEAPRAVCGIAGQSLGGLAALRAGANRPDAFGLVLAQSSSLWLEAPEIGKLTGDTEFEPRFRIEVGTHEWVLLEPNRAFYADLVGAGIDAELIEYAGGHDYACWRGGILDGIAELTGALAAMPR